MGQELRRLVTTMAVFLMLQGVMAGLDDGAASNPAIPGPEFAATNVPRIRTEAKPAAERTGRALWMASVAALAVANLADAKSSWQKEEANWMLAGSGGRFGAKGAAIKGGINAAWIVGQVMALRKNPTHRRVAVINFAAASIFGAIAYRNQRTAAPAGGLR